MKHTIILVLAITALIHSTAQAAQYEILVTHSVSVSPSQANLQTLVQKQILIDTGTRTLELPVSPVCSSSTSCSEMLHTVSFKITQASEKNGIVTSVTAHGTLITNGHTVPTVIQINSNPDNAMNISIINSGDCKGMHSDFIGSPAQAAAFLNVL